MGEKGKEEEDGKRESKKQWWWLMVRHQLAKSSRFCGLRSQIAKVAA